HGLAIAFRGDGPAMTQFPGQSGADDRVEIGMARLPAEPLARQRRIGDQLRRVARPPRRLAARHLPAADAFDGGDDLAYRAAAAGAEIERAAVAACGEVIERTQMRVGEIGGV